MKRRRDDLPGVARLLLGLVRGEGAEFVRGDLEESWRARRGSAGATARWIGDAIRTVITWWLPTSVLRRRRLANGTGSGGGLMRGAEADIRHALRGVGLRPGYSLLVVATLGLGIGATTTIYSVVDAVVVRSLPYADADQIVVAGNLFPGREWVEGTSLQAIAGVSGPNLLDWRERTRTLSSLEAVEFRMNLLPDEGQGPRLIPFGDVTPGFLGLLGARIQLGRGFLREDLSEDSITKGEVPLILSHAVWMSAAGGDASILGRPAPGVPGTRVIGVLAPDFTPPEALFGRTAIGHWRPMESWSRRYAIRGERRLQVIGRLAPGVTIDAARYELAGIQANVAREHPDGNVYPDGSALGAGLNGLQAQTVGGTGRILVLFLASSMLLLIIAAINAANLLLVRGLDREREMSVRLALGATRWRVARTVLIESLVLALAGGAVGSLLAAIGVETFIRLVPPNMPRLSEVALNARVLAISAVVTIGLGVLAGLIPALRQGAVEPATHSKAAAATSARSGQRLRMSLVASQLALAVVLGTGATLVFRSFLNVATAEPGFDPAGLATFSAFTKRPSAGPEAPRQVWDELLEGVRSVGGVRAAATSNMPFQSPDWAPAIQFIEDAPTARRPAGAGYVVTPEFFDVMGIPVLDGRGLRSTDGATGPSVVVANEAFVRRNFPNGSAVGRRIRVWGDDGSLEERELVGVVGNTIQMRVQDGLQPALYFPYTQVDWPQMNVVVRSDRDLADLAPGLRAAARRFNPIAPAVSVERVTDRIRRSLTEPRFQAMLFLAFATVAVLLAAIGLYGTLTHVVGRRGREFGIRMAVGADRRRIFGMVMGQGMRVFAIGLAAGLAAAAVGTRFLRSFLFGVGVVDPMTFALCALILTLVASLAIARPARRATGIDPATSLRGEG